MADVFVGPEHLEQLATVQDQATQTAQAAGSVGPTGADIHQQLYLTHGAISGLSNDAITHAVVARAKATEITRKVSADLAVELRAARDAYQSADEQLSRTLSR